MADKKANQGTAITPETRVANNIIRLSNEDGTAGNGLKIAITDFSLRDIQTTRNACIALLASSGSAITTGQGYVFDGLDGAIPTGISLIRVRGINTGGAVKAFSPNAEALVTALGVYVPCTYDVATNKLRLQIRGYKTSLTTVQIKNLYVGGTYVEVVPAFGANTFTDVKHISTYLNIPGATYNNAAGFYFSYDPDAGNILFNNPIDFLGSGGEYYIQFQQQFDSIDNVKVNTPVYVFDNGSFTPSTTGSGSADIYIDFDVIFN